MESTISFIELIKNERAIYDITHEDYKNPDRRAKAWMNIASEVGMTIDSCKRKWKNLRDSYTKYLRSYRLGAKTSRKYQFWIHAEHMDFLRPFQGPGRAARTNVNESDTNEPPLPCSGSNENVIEDVNHNSKVKRIITSDIEDRATFQKTNKSEVFVKDRSKLFKRDESSLETSNMDSTSLFFLSLAKSVRAMPKKHQTAVKMLCMKIVSDAEIEIENGAYDIETHVSVTNDSFNNHENIVTVSKEHGESNKDQTETLNGGFEHFTYVMSPSKIETMIDLSSDEDAILSQNIN